VATYSSNRAQQPRKACVRKCFESFVRKFEYALTNLQTKYKKVPVPVIDKKFSVLAFNQCCGAASFLCGSGFGRKL
jgi:hypothetical protein